MIASHATSPSMIMHPPCAHRAIPRRGNSSRAPHRLRALCLRALCAGLCIALAPQAHAQQRGGDPELRPSYGVFGGASINLHRADFSELPGVPSCCGGYQSGSGAGIALGLAYALPIDPAWAFHLQAAYDDRSATLTRDQAIKRFLFLYAGNLLSTIGNQVFGFGLGSLLALLGLGYILYLLYTTSQSPKRQGFHDVQAGTVVVKHL